MLVSKNSTQRDPNVSRWNIGRVGSPRVRAHVGHVDFMLFVSNLFALGTQHKPSFWWNMGIPENSKYNETLSDAHHYADNCLTIRQEMAEIFLNCESNFYHVGKCIAEHCMLHRRSFGMSHRGYAASHRVAGPVFPCHHLLWQVKKAKKC